MNSYSYDYSATASIVPHGMNGARLGDPVSVSVDLPWYLWVTFVVAPAALIGYGIYTLSK